MLDLLSRPQLPSDKYRFQVMTKIDLLMPLITHKLIRK